MNMWRVAGLAVALVCGESFARMPTAGWDNVNPDRAWPQTTNVVWRAPLAEGAAAFDVSLREGAEGTVEFRADGIRIVKTNSRGAIVVAAKRPFRHVNRLSPRTFANVREVDGDPMRSLGFLRIWSGKENLTIAGDGAYGPSPLNHFLISTEPDGKVRKLALPPTESAAGPDFTPAIVVAGAPSTSFWTDWGAEDVGDADQAWKKYKADRWKTGVRNHSAEVSPADEVMRAIAADTDHTAKVVKRDGFARLTIDGRDAPPVFYKGYGGPFAYCGRRMEEKADLRLQIAGITFGGRVTNDPGIRPHWTREGFDLTGAVERVRHYLCAAPNSLFLLGISVNPYPAFADDHPSERWIGPDGQPVRGRGCIVAWDQKAAAKDPKAWTLTSQFSPLWREQVKTHISALVAELKRTGLAKRIVGVHLSGSHDGQFGMPLYDYSPHAKAAYRRFLAAHGKPSADPPDFTRYGTAEGGVDFFRDPKDRDLVDFQKFIHHASVDLQEDLARHAKACFGKDVIAVKYCLSVFAGLKAGEFDFTRFLNSDAIDVFAAQSCYKRRPAAIPIPEKRVTASLHEHGKLFVSELDFEAYHRGPTFCRDEFAAMSWGYLLDYPMWEAANRKAVGQMLAQRQGFWYYDMGGDYFDDDRMLADIRNVMATTRRLVRGTPSAWRPSAAVVVDEKGMMFRNFSRSSHGTIVDARDSVAEQLALLEMSAAPFDTWLMDDFLRRPELAERYRTVMLLGSYELDAPRREMVGRLCRGGRTVVLGSGAGIVGGAAEIGLPLDVVPRQQAPGHEIVPAPGYADEDVKGFFETEALRVALGAVPGTPKHAVRRPHRVSVAAAEGVETIGRYAADGATAIAAKRVGEGRIVAVCDQMGLTPSLFNRLVCESGGYVCGRPGRVQVNMNGDFVSVHCLRGGHYDLELPFAAKVSNLKSGQVERSDGKVLPLELTAGRTCWFALAPLDAEVTAQKAQFISPVEKREGHTVASFCKELTNAKEIRSATLSATALGVFEVEVNGTKVGSDFLKPGFTECGKCRHVFTYDVTHLMKTAKGAENCFIAQVAPTWWCDQINRAKAPTPWQLGKEVAFRGELAVEYADGSHETFGTGTDWLATYSACTQTAGLYEGEVVDRRESIDFLKPAKVNDEFHGELRPATAKIRLREDLTLAPKDIYVTCGAEGATSNAYGRAKVVRRYRDGDEIVLDKGEMLVLDFGQNCSAVPMLQFSGRAGTTLELRHAEMLNEANGEKSRGNDGPAGTPYLASLRSAYAGIRYTLAGGGDTYRPSFTFFGYRYIGVTTTAPVRFQRIRSIPVSSVTKEMERGSITTGNARVNRLIENVRWGMRSNFISIPTDCPQRDERLGWTADTQVFMNTAAYFADTWDFLRKYLGDLRDGQTTNGLYRCFAPNVRHVFPPWASCGWTDAGVIIPYRLWKWYGKREVIDENWDAMDRYMGFLRSHKTPYQINHADWLAYEHKNPKKGGLMQDPQYVKVLNAYFPIWMARLMKEMAAATGRTADAARYAQEEVRYHRAFAETYVGEDGCMKDYWKGQCSDLYMLKLGLCGNAAAAEATKRHLIEDIRAHGNQLQTGFLGTAILMPTLTFEAGAPDVAYDLLLQDKDPSWLYSVDQGATTVWERWNSYTKAKGFGPTSMNSFNHYAYGCVVEWLFAAAAGIRPDPAHPGWTHFLLRPHPDRRLGAVDATYDSPAGRIRSAWSYAADGTLRWEFSIPAGASATVTAPDGTVREYGPGEYRSTAGLVAGRAKALIVDFGFKPGPGPYGCASDPAVFERELVPLATTMRVRAEELSSALDRATGEDLLIVPCGSAFPVAAWGALTNFLVRGGSLLTTGGYAFDAPLVRRDGRWQVEPSVHINKRHGQFRDCLKTEPTQIGAFDPSFPLTNVASVALSSVQDGILPSVRLDGGLVGFAAVGVLGENGHGYAPNAATWRPILEAYGPRGREKGPVGAFLRHYRGAYRGSHWAIFGATDRDLFADGSEGAHKLLPAVVKRLLDRLSLAETTAGYACYRKGETSVVKTQVANFGPRDREVSVRLVLRNEKGVPVHETSVPVTARRGTTTDVQANWTVPEDFADDLVSFAAELTADGTLVDREDDAFAVWQEKTVAQGPKLAADGTLLSIDGRRRFAFGCQTHWAQYQPYTARSPKEMAADFKAMRTYGFRWARLFLRWDSEFCRRISDAAVLLAQKYGLVIYHTQQWMDARATGEELAKQNAVFSGIAARYRDVPGFALDICNEPRLDGVAPSPEAVAQEKNWADSNFAAARKTRPDLLVSVGHSQGWGGGRSTKDPAIGILGASFTDRHYYGPWGRMFEDLKDVDQRAIGKPLVLAECGAKCHPTFAAANADGVGDTEERYCARFKCYAAQAFGLGCSAMLAWMWRDPMEGIFPCGIVHQTRVPRQAAKTLARMAQTFGRFELVENPPDVVVCLDEGPRMKSEGRRAYLDRTDAVDRALLHWGANWSKVTERAMDQTKGVRLVLRADELPTGDESALRRDVGRRLKASGATLARRAGDDETAVYFRVPGADGAVAWLVWNPNADRSVSLVRGEERIEVPAHGVGYLVLDCGERKVAAEVF